MKLFMHAYTTSPGVSEFLKDITIVRHFILLKISQSNKVTMVPKCIQFLSQQNGLGFDPHMGAVQSLSVWISYMNSSNLP